MALLFWKKEKVRLVFIFLIFIFLGLWRFSYFVGEINSREVFQLNNNKQVFDGFIKNNPESTPKNQQFIIKTENKRGEANVLVYASIYPVFSYGDKLQLECILKKPEAIDDFSYDKFLAMKNTDLICYYPKIELLSPSEANPVLALIYKVKNSLKEQINNNIGEPGASVINAMVLGDKKFISEEVRLDFSKAGISHIIAISGMHIGIFIVGLGAILFLVGAGRNLSFYLIALFLIFYNILISFPSSSLRASLMGILILYSFKIGRLNKVYNSIALAAFIIVLANPMVIRYDLGFIFSFAAVLGIIYFFPIFSEKYKKVESRIMKYPLDIMSVSVAAQIFILPVIILNFGVLSLISPVVNLMVIGLLPFILIGVFASFFLSLIFPAMSFFFFLPIKILMSYIFSVVDLMINIPLGVFIIDNFSKYYALIYYLLIILYIFYRKKMLAKNY